MNKLWTHDWELYLQNEFCDKHSCKVCPVGKYAIDNSISDGCLSVTETQPEYVMAILSLISQDAALNNQEHERRYFVGDIEFGTNAADR